MKPASFEYHRVFTADEAVTLLAELDDEAKVLAGGQSLAPMMNFRLARPSALVDINPVGELDYVRRDGDVLKIGALTRHRTIELLDDPSIIDGYGVLPSAARHIGHFPIRTRGTVGGSIAHSDPSAEWCLLALLLDAQIVTLGPQGRRETAARDWFTGFLTTSIEPGEIVVETAFPRPRARAALTEYAQRKGDFAICSAAVAYDDADGVMSDPAIVLGGVASEPFRSSELDEIASGLPAEPSSFTRIARAAADLIDPPSDLHGDSAYRKDLAQTMIERAFAEAADGPVSAR
ncbi:xanthine dehydrogenase family protein subunit M [Epidermidibacterium keratini]|uniref:Xanthine dehydrogenase family protein subunit M n=1 Tax=Epidermidibacterium keratini TaxID=1891644 RepID=A0A7L4YKB6_9ACTN|nr:xanthine dehydrogenase family protein subunit M [Epidermidibacterium keratini]QHB99700.1 xanthine dehydrogenase family protein subunit M [Epidermidibacterium keratini]